MSKYIRRPCEIVERTPDMRIMIARINLREKQNEVSMRTQSRQDNYLLVLAFLIFVLMILCLI